MADAPTTPLLTKQPSIFEVSRLELKRMISIKAPKTDLEDEIIKLEKMIKEIEDPQQRAERYYELSCMLTTNEVLDWSLQFIQLALELRMSLSQDNSKFALIYCQFAMTYDRMKANHEVIIEHFNLSLKHSKELDDGKTQLFANVNYYMAAYLLKHKDFEDALVKYSKAIEVYQITSNYKLSMVNSLKGKIQVFLKMDPEKIVLKDVIETFNLALDQAGVFYEPKLNTLIAFCEEAYSNLELILEKINKSEELSVFVNMRIETKGESYDAATNLRKLAEKQYNEGHLQKAKETYLKVIKVFTKFKDDLSLIECYNVLGLICNNLNEYDQAREYYDFAISLVKDDGKPNEIFAVYHNNMASVLSNQKLFKEAIESFEKSLQLRKELGGDQRASIANLYSNIGICYEKLGKYAEAINYQNDALKTYEEMGADQEVIAEINDKLAHVLYFKGEYDQAGNIYQKNIDIYSALFENNTARTIDLARAYSGLGSILESKGKDNDGAIKYLSQAMEIFNSPSVEKNPKIRAEIAEIHTKLGQAYSNKGLFPQAKEEHNEALKIRREVFTEKSDEVANSLENIGSVYNNIGEYPQAIEYYDRAIKIRVELENLNTHVLGGCFVGLGLSQNNQLLFDEAILSLNKARDYYEASKLDADHPDFAVVYKTLGTIFNNKEDYNQCLKNLNEALKISEKKLGFDSSEVAVIHNLIGQALINKKKYKEAEEHHNTALNIFLTKYPDGEHPEIGNTYVYLGQVYTKLNQIHDEKEKKEEGREFLKKAENIFRDKYPKFMLKVNIELGHAHKADEKEKAREYYKKAIDILINEYKRNEKHSTVIEIQNFLSTLDAADTKDEFEILKKTHPQTDLELLMKMEKPIPAYKYALELVPDDGSCMFHCIAFAMYPEEYNKRKGNPQDWFDFVQKLRDIAAQVIKDKIENFKIPKKLDEYIADLKKPATWGGEYELKAFAIYYGVTFSVVEVNRLRAVMFPKDIYPEKPTGKKIFLVLDKLTGKSAAHYHCMYAQDPENPEKRVTVFEDEDKIFRSYAYYTASLLIGRN